MVYALVMAALAQDAPAVPSEADVDEEEAITDAVEIADGRDASARLVAWRPVVEASVGLLAAGHGLGPGPEIRLGAGLSLPARLRVLATCGWSRHSASGELTDPQRAEWTLRQDVVLSAVELGWRASASADRPSLDLAVAVGVAAGPTRAEIHKGDPAFAVGAAPGLRAAVGVAAPLSRGEIIVQAVLGHTRIQTALAGSVGHTTGGAAVGWRFQAREETP